MADIFISYSKRHAQPTIDLARDLEAQGYTTWWDTRLLPGDEFPDKIRRQLDVARAVIVIWTESSVNSKWVRAEATRADAHNKLITVCDASLDFLDIPLPFNTRHTELVTDRAKIFGALTKRGIHPANGTRTETPSASSERSEGNRETPTQKTIDENDVRTISLKSIIDDIHRDNKNATITQKRARSKLRAKYRNHHDHNAPWMFSQNQYDDIRSMLDPAYATRIERSKTPAKQREDLPRASPSPRDGRPAQTNGEPASG